MAVPGYPPQPPQRGRQSAGVIALVVITALAVLAGLFVVAIAVTEDRQQDADRAAAIEHVPATTPLPTTAPATTVPPTKARPTTTPTKPAGPQPANATAKNPLTVDIGLRSGGCELPKWSRREDGVRAFLNAVVACLDKKWQPIMAGLKLPWNPPKVVITLEIEQHDCIGKFDPYNSQQCRNTIYLVPDSYLKNSVGVDNAGIVAAETVAHEYAHHIQSLSGILGASWAEEVAVGSSSPAGLEASRRIELQAQCLAGVFMGATFDAATVDIAVQEQYHRGDYPGRDPDHGQPERSGAWFKQGATRNKLSDCNTFAVDSAAVR